MEFLSVSEALFENCFLLAISHGDRCAESAVTPSDPFAVRDKKAVSQPDIFGGGADLHLNFPFFNFPTHIFIQKGCLARSDGEADRFFLTGREYDARKALQFLYRSCH